MLNITKVGSHNLTNQVPLNDTLHRAQVVAGKLDELPPASLCPRLNFALASGEILTKLATFRRCQVSDSVWGNLTPQEAISCFELAIRVQDAKEAEAILSTIATATGLKIGPLGSTEQLHSWVQSRIELTHFSSTCDGELELRIRPNFKRTAASSCCALLESLVSNFDLRVSDKSIFDIRNYDFQQRDDRRNWANDSFHEWYLGLSGPELMSLKLLGSSGYHEIHRALRNSGNSDGSARVADHILNIDRAIERGRLNRDVLLHRAVGAPFDQIASILASQPGVIEFQEPAYLFFSIHSDVAHGWNRALQNGVILEIAAPRGIRAAFLQVPGIFPDRIHDEIVLARGTRMIFSEVRNHDGISIITGRIESTEGT